MTNPDRPPLFSDRVAGMAAEIGHLRRSLHKVITLADEAPQLSDAQLRARLLALAMVLRPGPPKPADEGPGSP